MPRLTCVEGGSSKFWEGSVEGSVLRVRFGRIGTDGQGKDKDLGTPDAARQELEKLVREKLGKGYVAEVSDAAGAPDASGDTPAPVGDGRFPFLFYGACPGDWAEGANAGHAYDVRFATRPDPAARAAIAEAFEKAAKKSAVDPDAPAWRWAADWAFFFVGERYIAKFDRFFEDMQACLRAVHRAAPIAEVVYWNAQAPNVSDEWTNWSIGIQPRPSLEPAYPPFEPFGCWGQRTDPSIGEPVEDGRFERIRREVRTLGRRMPEGAISMVDIDRESVPTRPLVPKEVEDRFGDRAWVDGFDADHAVARVDHTILYLDQTGNPKPIALAADGRRALVSPERQAALLVLFPRSAAPRTSVYELDLPGGALSELASFAAHDEDADAVWVGDDRLAVLVDRHVMILGRDGTRYDTVGPIEDARGLVGARGGRLVFVRIGNWGKQGWKSKVFRTDGDLLDEVGELGEVFGETWDVGGRLIAGEPKAIFAPYHEILGADEVLAAPVADRPRRPDAGPALVTGTSVEPEAASGEPQLDAAELEAVETGKLGLVRVLNKEAVLPEPLPDAIAAKFGDVERIVGRAGAYVAITKDGKLAYLDPAGAVRTAEATGAAHHPYVTPDGKRAYFTTIANTTNAYRLDLASGACDEIRNWSMRDEGACVVPVGDADLAMRISVFFLLGPTDRDDEVFTQFQGYGGGDLFAARDGRLVFLVTGASKDPVHVFRADGHKLRRLAKLGPRFSDLWERDGHIFVGRLPHGDVYEVVNVDAVLPKKK